MASKRSQEAGKNQAMDTMRLVTLAMDLPILVAIFAYIGYLIGKRYEPQGVFFGILIGGLLGFLVGLLSTFKVTGVLRQRERNKESKQQEI